MMWNRAGGTCRKSEGEKRHWRTVFGDWITLQARYAGACAKFETQEGLDHWCEEAIAKYCDCPQPIYLSGEDLEKAGITDANPETNPPRIHTKNCKALAEFLKLGDP